MDDDKYNKFDKYKKVQSNNYNRIVVSGLKNHLTKWVKNKKEQDRNLKIALRKREFLHMAEAGKLSKDLGIDVSRKKNSPDCFIIDVNHRIEIRITKEFNYNDSRLLNIGIAKKDAFYPETEFKSLPLNVAEKTIDFLVENIAPCLVK